MIIYTKRLSKKEKPYTCIIIKEEGHPDTYIFDPRSVFALSRAYGVTRTPQLNEDIVLYNGFCE